MTTKKARKLSPDDLLDQASAETGNKPPQAPEVEEAVIGSMMMDSDSLYLAMESLTENSFYDPRHRLVFASIERLFKESSAVDLVTVTEQLRKDGTMKKVGGAARLASLTSKVCSGANVEYYVKILQQKTIQRDLITAGYGILRKAFDETYEVDRLIEEAQTDVYKAVQGNLKQSYVDVGDALNRALDRLQWVQQTDGLTGVPSGFPSLDAITRGWQDGNLIVIGARPGHGKSAIALNMARCAAVENGIPTAMFTLEMRDIELADRLIGMETGLSSGKRKGREKMEQYEWEMLDRALDRALRAPLYIDETPALTITEFTSKIKRMVQEKGIKIVFVDYLQLMHASASLSQYRALEIGEISRQLKETAKELHIPIIALAQLNRNLMSRQGTNMGRPVLSDLKDSGSIEQDADMVLFIHRPALLGLTERYDDDLAELIIAKNRSGEMGIIPLHFNGEQVRFTEGGETLTDYAERQLIPSAANESVSNDLPPNGSPASYDFEEEEDF